jgi:hypothetical protein
MSSEKRVRRNIFDLKNNHPEEFGRFVLALDSLQKSDDWERICGIHGLTFNPTDKGILCPRDAPTVSRITGLGEPQYCPHGVKHFLAWHTVYLKEFELLLKKYDPSKNKDFISLPYLDVPNIKSDDYSFLSSKNITIQFNSKKITISNPLVGGKINRYGSDTITKRNGYLNPKTRAEINQMYNVQIELDNCLRITNYESLSSTDIPKGRTTFSGTIPIETPHNTCHTSLGGRGGAMSVVTTAAHDPIFWLHHCNLDRYFYYWFVKVTQNFTKKLSKDEILPETLNLSLAPFFSQSNSSNQIYNDDLTNYKFCWENNTGKFLKISDVIDLSKYNYTYESYKPKQNLVWKPQYCEIVGIPTLPESCDIKLYIVPNDLDFRSLEIEQKEDFLAGSACWIGINRNEIFCERCEKTRTNITINISSHLFENKITKKNIQNYQLILEGDGLGVENQDGTFNTYSHEQVLQDGKLLIIFDVEDILANREFKFERKHLHTKLAQSIIEKLNKLGYTISDSDDWEHIIKTKERFESDWGIEFKELIKMKLMDKLGNYDQEENITVIKDLIVESYQKKSELVLNFILGQFPDELKTKIYQIISEWETLFVQHGVDLKFYELEPDVKQEDENKPIHFKLDFLEIDGEYGICGSTYLVRQSQTVQIDIDSSEDYSIFHLIVTHELGHAFGLTHNSNPKSIMHPFVSEIDKKVSSEDIWNILEN